MSIAKELAHGAYNEVNFAFAPSLILWTAVELKVFPTLAQEAVAAEELARILQCSEKGVRRILDCLAAMGFVNKRKAIYDLAPLAQRYFLPASEHYLGDLFASCPQLLKYWLVLPHAVKTGRPILSLFPDKEKQRYNAQVVEALYQFHKKSAWQLASAFPKTAHLTKILDVAAGSAVWSIPFAVRYPNVEVAAVDFASVLGIARKYARRWGVESRYRFVGGDIRTTDFGAGQYDLALLGHICHSEGQQRSRLLVRKCFRALKKGGKLLIMDYIADEKRKSDLLALLVSINALMGTDEGDAFTLGECSRWLTQAGYKSVTSIPLEGHYPCIVAAKGN
jgi:ubiquinone/menaquinone biosynthesis C-methylase UbiE